MPLPRYGKWASGSSTTSTIGSSQELPVGASGQLGKEQALPCAENLFSWCGVRLGEFDGMPHGRSCPSSPELSSFRGSNVVPLKQFQRLLGHMASAVTEAQVDQFASHNSSQRQLYFSLTEGPLGTDALAHSWPRALRKYAFPPVSLLAQTLWKLREDEEQVLLVAPHWPTRTWFPELISLTTAPPWCIPLRKDLLSQGLGTIWHPRPDLWNLYVWLLDRTRQT